MQVAMTELDPTVIVQRIIDSKNSNFNLDALIALKDLGIDTDIYPNLGGTAYKIQFKREQVRQETIRVEIDQLSLQMVFGVGYVASYTMSWVNPGGKTMIPAQGHHTIWSKRLPVGKGQTMKCTDFVYGNLKLEPGALVYMQIHCFCQTKSIYFDNMPGYTDASKTIKLIYRPGAHKTFKVSASGSVFHPNYDFEFIPPQ